MQAKIVKGREPISEEQMYELYNIDRDFRDTAKLKHNNRVTTVKNKEGEIAQAINHQTTIDLKPKYGSLVPEWTVELLTALLAEKNPENRIPTLPIMRTESQSDKLGGLMLTDLHLNSLDRDSNSFKTRCDMASERVKRTMDRLLKFDPSQLLVANLGDMNDSDIGYKTSSGKVATQNNILQKEGYKRILEREIKMLEEIQANGIPTKYVKMSGNHDDNTAFQSAIALKYYFMGRMDVESPLNRFYEVWGHTLVALSHGDRGRGKKLFDMIVDECISKCTTELHHLYAYLGHNHKTIIEQHGPIEIKSLQAPLPKSERCDKYGYDMKQSMTGYVRSKEEGQILEVRG